MSDNLAKARAAVAPLIAHDTGDRPRWRIVHTDSESPSGVALTCTGENSDALHMIDDYPGGPIRDEEGVYDCCPWPQFETYSPVLAAYLVELLNADAEEKATDAQSATATPAGPTGRVAQLLDAIRTAHGRWTTVTAFRFYRDHLRDLDNIPNTQLRAVARGDLRDLAAWGHLLRHEEPGRQYYTLKARKDGQS
jgi:hypothetical protein